MIAIYKAMLIILISLSLIIATYTIYWINTIMLDRVGDGTTLSSSKRDICSEYGEVINADICGRCPHRIGVDHSPDDYQVRCIHPLNSEEIE